MVGEADCDDAVCDLADLLGGMGPAIMPVDLNMINRQRLHPQIRGPELGAKSATAWHALPLRR
jgi:hypothetical protein